MKKLAAIIVLLLSLSAACDSTSVKPDAEEVDTNPENYLSWEKVTKQPHMASSRTIALCAPATFPDQEKEALGPHYQKPINIYLNEPALNALKNNLPYPPNSAIVKEKLDDKYNPISIGAMVKKPDGLWEYYYNDKEVVRGRIETCVNCHSSKSATDEVYGYWKYGTDYNN